MSMLQNLKQKYDRSVNALLGVPTSYWERLFSGILLLYFAALVAVTFTYPGADQRFPLVAGVGTLLLLLLVFASLQFQTIDDVMARFEGIDLMGGKNLQEKIGQTGADDIAVERQRLQSFQTFGWILAAFFFCLVLGILPGIFLFMLLYYRWWAGFTWRTSIAYSVFVWIFIYVAFDVLLEVRFWGGILEFFGKEIIIPVPF